MHISEESGRHPSSTFGDRKHCAFVWYQNIRSALFSFVTIHASDRWTDRQTDRTDLRQQYHATTTLRSYAIAVKCDIYLSICNNGSFCID